MQFIDVLGAEPRAASQYIEIVVETPTVTSTGYDIPISQRFQFTSQI